MKTYALLTSLLCMALPAVSQTYPSGPIKIVVSYSAGASAADILARVVGKALSTSMGVPVIVDNKPGAGGTIGANMVAKSKPDGYTIGLGYNAEYIIAQFFNKAIPYNSSTDFTAIAGAAEIPMAIAVNPSIGINSTEDLLARIKNTPEKVSIGTAGVGTTGHLAVEMLMQVTGLKVLHVPYKGTAAAITDLIGGQLPVVVGSVASLAPNHESGKLKILSVVEKGRSTRLPNIPAVGEKAVNGYAFPSTWLGFFAPAGLPPPILHRLNTEIVAALNDPVVRVALESAGVEVTGTSSSQLATMVKTETEVFRKITSAAGIQPQ